jgi:hypothetical protein
VKGLVSLSALLRCVGVSEGEDEAALGVNNVVGRATGGDSDAVGTAGAGGSDFKSGGDGIGRSASELSFGARPHCVWERFG